MPYIRLRRSRRRSYRRYSLRARSRRYLRRYRSRRHYGRRTRIFNPRQLFPTAVKAVVKLSRPIVIFNIGKSASAVKEIVMSFVNNSLGTEAYVSSQSVLSRQPRGVLESINLKPSTIGSTTNSMAVTDSNLRLWAGSAQPVSDSANWHHLGNVYSRYRVTKSTMALTLEPTVTQQDDNATLDSQAQSSYMCVNLWATDDADLSNSTSSIGRWCSRPQVSYMKPHKTITLARSAARTRPAYAALTTSPHRLYRGRSTLYDEDWVGTCTPDSGGGFPTYNAPARATYTGVCIHDLASAQLPFSATQDTCLLIGYMYWTWNVYFFARHSEVEMHEPL